MGRRWWGDKRRVLLGIIEVGLYRGESVRYIVIWEERFSKKKSLM